MPMIIVTLSSTKLQKGSKELDENGEGLISAQNLAEFSEFFAKRQDLRYPIIRYEYMFYSLKPLSDNSL